MKSFHYRDDPYNGFFKYFRSISKPIPVTIIRETDHITGQNQFCDRYKGETTSAIIDGNNNTAWCNEDHIESQQYFTLDFQSNTFKLNKFTFRTTCAPPRTLFVRGSDDDKEYQNICSVFEMREEDSTYVIECNDLKKDFRFIKFQQIGLNYNNTNRLLISELELFGILNPIPITLVEKLHLRHLTMHFLSVILST